MIDWNKYFDKIYVISYIYNFDRREKIKKEFERLGITNYKFFINIDNELLVFNEYYNKNQINCANGYYNVLKQMIGYNYNNILMMDDDCVFLKDLNKIQEYLNIYIESQSDIFLFTGCHQYFEYLDIYNIYYVQCYAVNQSGAKYLIDMHELNKCSHDLYYYIINKNYQYGDIYINNINENKVSRSPAIHLSELIYDIKIDALCMHDLLPICIESNTNSRPYFEDVLQFNNDNLNLYNL